MVVELAVRQAHADHYVPGIAAAGLDVALGLQQLPLGQGELDINGVMADEGGQRPRLWPNQVADGVLGQADAPRDRGQDLRVAKSRFKNNVARVSKDIPEPESRQALGAFTLFLNRS